MFRRAAQAFAGDVRLHAAVTQRLALLRHWQLTAAQREDFDGAQRCQAAAQTLLQSAGDLQRLRRRLQRAVRWEDYGFASVLQRQIAAPVETCVVVASSSSSSLLSLSSSRSTCVVAVRFVLSPLLYLHFCL